MTIFDRAIRTMQAQPPALACVLALGFAVVLASCGDDATPSDVGRSDGDATAGDMEGTEDTESGATGARVEPNSDTDAGSGADGEPMEPRARTDGGAVDAGDTGTSGRSDAGAIDGGGRVDAGLRDATTGQSDASVPPAGGANCNSTAPNDAPTIEEIRVTSPAPTPAGGAIVDGIYLLTKAEVHVAPDTLAPGPTGKTYKETWVFSTVQNGTQTGRLIQLKYVDNKGAPASTTHSWMQQDTRLGTLMVCPTIGAGVNMNTQFTATADEIKIFKDGLVRTLMKQ